MSSYVPGGSGGGSSPFAPSGPGGSVKYGSAGSPPSVYQPTAPGGGTGQAGGVTAPSDTQPGVISVNPLDPGGSAAQAGESGTNFLEGLADTLFGPHTGVLTGGLTGAIQDDPGIVGAAGRGAGQVLGGVGTGIGAAASVVGGGLERIPADQNNKAFLDAKMQDPEVQKWLDEKVPGSDQTNREKYAGDKGLFDSGLFSNADHMKTEALREFHKANNTKHPDLFAGQFETPGSLADTIGNSLNLTMALGVVYNRQIAGLHGRAGEAKAIGEGSAVSTGFLGTGLFAGSSEATPAEKLVAQKLSDGSWTEDEATDFLVATGATAHDATLSVALSVATPDLAASFGMGTLAKAGIKGIQMGKSAEIAGRLLEEANVAHSVAEAAVEAAKATRAGKAAIKVGDTTRTMQKADKALEAAKSTLAERQAAVESFSGSRTIKFGEVYKGLEHSYVGRAAKLTRTLIDPTHAIDLKSPASARMVDLYSDALPTTLHKTMNPIEGLRNFDMFDDIDKTGVMSGKYGDGITVGITNRGRELLLGMHQGAAVDRGLAGALQSVDGALRREDVINDAAKHVRESDLLGAIREDVVKNILRPEAHWTQAAHEKMAKQLESIYGMRTAEEWLAELPKMSKERKSLLDFSIYGHSNSELIDAISDAKGRAHPAVEEFNLDRAVLLSTKTLTKIGADSLLSKLDRASKAKGAEKKAIAIIHDWQERYPQLAYIHIDSANPGKSIKNFVRYVEDNMESFPMQFKADELAKMPDRIKNLSANLGDGYQLGFRPKEEFLWGIERANEAGGKYIAKTVPWADHVGLGGRGFRPGLQLPTNIAGMPLVGVPLTKAARMVDYMGAGATMLTQQVTGQQIHAIARAKFIADASSSNYSKFGLTESVASQWWDRLQEYTREHQGYSGPRGFGKGDLYKAIADEGLIPSTMLNGSMKLTENDVLRFVLNAYDGDMRFIGMTQKLSGRVKVMLSAMTGYQTNFAGQIAEHAWPLLKFRYNPIFQLQEKIEPFVLNVQRGITSPFWKPNLSAADQRTESLLQRLTDGSLIRQADLDQAEYVQLLNFDKRIKMLAGDSSSRMSKMAAAAGQIMDVQGVKRVGALRTFRHGLGKEIRAAWDEVMPGVFDDMKATADAMAGRFMHEDEFAVQLMSENLLSNDIIAGRLGKAGEAAGIKNIDAWENSIKTGEWLRPTHVGAIQSLDLDHVARAMGGFEDGTKVKDVADLRRVIAGADHPEKALEEVSEFLRRLGASKDYVGRVENALTFSWTGFWKEAEKRYNLTFDESKRLQDFIAAAGEVRGVNPIDFMSQMFDPGIIDGTEGLLGSLDKPLGVIRKNKEGLVVGRGRSRLAAPAANTATREDLVKQISAVFSQHLDPSAKRALLMEFRPELLKRMKADARTGTGLKLDSAEVKDMWDAEADDVLGDRILGYMDGKYGSADHALITDANQGVESVRRAADKYLRDHGVTPMEERRNYKTDDVHYQRVADEYSALPEIEYEKTGRRPMSKSLLTAGPDLKPQPAGVDDRTYKAYQQFVHEVQDQFGYLTRPKAKGGMGLDIIVAKGDPYTADEAGRAAMKRDIERGKLRVMGIDSDHPLMTNEQNIQFRAVHDVFGHVADGFQMGPRGEMNAAGSHFKMFSPEARGPLLTETHGQTAYVNYSKDVIPGPAARAPLDTTDPVLDFEARHPFEADPNLTVGYPDMPPDEFRRVTLSGDPDKTTGRRPNLPYTYTQRVGESLKAMSPEAQAAILQPIEDLMQDFPNLKIHHIDVIDFDQPLSDMGDNMLTGLDTHTGAFAITFGAGVDGEGPVILFNSAYVQEGAITEDWLVHHLRNEYSRQYDTFNKMTPSGTVKDMPRETSFGTPHNAVAPGEQFSLATVARHEAGHAFDVERRRQVLNPALGEWEQKAIAGQERYGDMMDRFEKAAGRLHLSEYGFHGTPDFAAELFAFATYPGLDMAKVKAIAPELHDMVDEFQKYLKEVGEWTPAKAAHPFAGKTVAEANAAKRGSVYAPQKAGLLPQSTIDEFAERYVGVGKHVESNPDVARVAQHFGAWSQKVLQNGLLDGSSAVHAGLLQDVAKMPIEDAAPYNYTEAMAHQLAVSSMKDKWNDAFRLQYFKQSRSMLERSINHPMFGIYPASYMWGKIMPEVVQFIAKRPFGVRTGAGLSAAMRAKSEIALRREYDPEFDAKIEELGHSQALSFLGYMLPTLPWDISASAPQWMKDISGQGLDRAKAVAAGQEPDGLNLVQPFNDAAGKLLPLTTTVPWAGRAIDELNGPNTPQEQLQEALAEASKGQVTASELEGPLFYVLQELQAELAK